MMRKTFAFLALAPLLLFANDSQTPPPPQELDLFNKSKPAFIINGEFLYWTLSEGALDYAIRMKRPAWGPTDSFAQGDFERAEYDWDPGYRFAFGYYRAPNFWEVLGEWTYIHFKGHDHAKRPPAEENRYITGTFPQIFLNPIDYATSTIHLHLKMADLLVNRVFHPFDNPHLRLRLTGGVTGVWMHQGWKVRYFDAELNNTQINNKWRYWGFGFRGGTSFDWFWGNDFYVTGKCSTALVVGHYHNHAKQETSAILQPGDDPSVPVRDARYKDYRMSFSMQLMIGPSYQKNFSWCRLELFLGYEMSIWTNLQEIYRSTRAPADQAKETWINDGLIAMHGLTVRGTFNF
ncbi:MAG: Lpg1974 family pore-forming outer membrane protein [Simkaniaceae bacterium]